MSLSSSDIASIRTDYRKAALDETVVGNDPIVFFKQWFGEANAAKIEEVNAMTLATCSNDGKLHARIVLLKGVEDNSFLFFTNYKSAKGNELAANNNAALVFFWKELERQVRVEGIVEKLSDTESTLYFNSRPEGSKLGAWASPQSKVIEDRNVLEENYKKYEAQYQQNIPRPPHWGGYKLLPNKIEFWQGRSNRMHDRVVFIAENNGWLKHRLAP